MEYAVASPKPVPPLRVVKNGSKIRPRCALRNGSRRVPHAQPRHALLARQGHAHLAPSPRRLEGVARQVEQHLPELIRIQPGRHRPQVQLQLHAAGERIRLRASPSSPGRAAPAPPFCARASAGGRSAGTPRPGAESRSDSRSRMVVSRATRPGPPPRPARASAPSRASPPAGCGSRAPAAPTACPSAASRSARRSSSSARRSAVRSWKTMRREARPVPSSGASVRPRMRGPPRRLHLQLGARHPLHRRQPGQQLLHAPAPRHAAPSSPRMLSAARLTKVTRPSSSQVSSPEGSAVEDLLRAAWPAAARSAWLAESRPPVASSCATEVAGQRRDQEVRQHVAGEGEAEAHHQRRGRRGALSRSRCVTTMAPYAPEQAAAVTKAPRCDRRIEAAMTASEYVKAERRVRPAGQVHQAGGDAARPPPPGRRRPSRPTRPRRSHSP